MAEETKTYVFDSQAGRSSTMAPSALYAMMNGNDYYKHILNTLSKLQDMYDKAAFCNNAMQIMYVYNVANKIRNYLTLLMRCGFRGMDITEGIVKCDYICAQCNTNISVLCNKAIKDIVMGKLREFAISMF